LIKSFKGGDNKKKKSVYDFKKRRRFKMNIKSLALLLCFIVACSSAGFAASSQTHTFSGAVGDQLDLMLQNEDLALGDLSSGVADHELSSYKIKNNSRSGFSITISSSNANKGQLLAANASSTPEDGDLINYTVDVVENGTTSPDHFGGTFPDQMADELSSDLSIAISDVTKATKNGAFKIVMDVAEDSGAYEDTFSDTITVVLADI
jgi:hypothetical protein